MFRMIADILKKLKTCNAESAWHAYDVRLRTAQYTDRTVYRLEDHNEKHTDMLVCF